MDPKPGEARSAGGGGGELDEETIARRRSRRVSFAEITAVHVFDRDEDSVTPPGSAASGESSGEVALPLGILADHSDSDDSRGSAPIEEEEDDEDEEEGEQERFVRDMDLSSPGSAVGSVTSNDDDNFFGPVSTSFIKSGRLSEAGMSDDNNHDITLDSTAFSLHFRNIAPSNDPSSNSAGSVRTPIGDSMPTDSGGFVIIKGLEKQVSKLSDGKMGGSASGSNNMSIVVENPNRYDYGKISPTLEALLDRVNNCVLPNTQVGDSRKLSSEHSQNDSLVVEESAKGVMHICNENAPGAFPDPHLLDVHSMGVDTGQFSSPNRKASPSIGTSTNKKAQDASSSKVDDHHDAHEAICSGALVANTQDPDILSPPYRKSPNDMNLQSARAHQELFRNQESGIKHYSNSLPESLPSVPALAIVDGPQQLQESEYGMHTPKNVILSVQSSLPGLSSSLPSKQQEVFPEPAVQPERKLTHSSVQGGSEYKRHTSKTDVSPFQSPSPGFADSVQTNQQQLILDPAVQHQSNLMQSPAAEKPEHAIHTPTNAVSTHKLPLQGSVSLPAKQQQLCHDSAVQPQRNLMHSLGREESEYGVYTPERAVSPIQSSLQGSVSSLRAKRQQVFLDPAIQSQRNLMHSLAIESPPSSLKMEFARHGERISAIKDQISKSKMLKSPALIYAKPTLSSKDYLPIVRDNTLEKLNANPNIVHTSVSSISTKDKLTDVAREVREHEISLELSHSGTLSASNHSTLIHTKKNEVIGEMIELTKGISLQFFQSGITRNQNLLNTSPIERLSTPHVLDSSLRHTINKLKESDEALDTSGKAISSLQTPKKLHAAQGSCLASGADKPITPNFLLKGSDFSSSTSLTIPYSHKVGKLQSPKDLEKNNGAFYKHQKEIEQNFHFGCKNENMEMKKDSSNVKDIVFVRERTATSVEPAVEDAFKETAICLAEENVQSSKQKMNNDNNMLHSFNQVDMMSPISIQDPMRHDHDVNCQDLQPEQDSVNIQNYRIGRKRGIQQVLHEEKDAVSEISRTLKTQKLSPKVVGINSAKEHHMECNNEAQVVGGQVKQKHWTEILSKVCEGTKQLDSASVYGLRELDIMEGILAELHMSRKYERLSSSLGNLGDPRQKRVAEARSLLDKLVFEKAKLQLKHMKLDILSNKAELCQSRLQECVKLKSAYAQFLSARTVDTLDRLPAISINSSTGNQEEYNIVTSMKQELEVLDQKVKHLVKSFGASCKINANMSVDEVIKVVNDHWEMTNRCRIIQQDLQLWKLSKVVKTTNQCDIVLNYCNLLSQRFTINSNSDASIVVSNFMNKTGIEKSFPNMNACVAFNYVLKDKAGNKLASSKHFQQVTMETSLLLSTLLNVLEELFISQMELWNLTSSTFHSHCSGRLELQLCFVSLKSDRKITMCLDVSSLNSAVYPSEPSEIQIHVSKSETTFPLTTADEILTAAQRLQGGRPMILRLCKSISQMVEASS